MIEQEPLHTHVFRITQRSIGTNTIEANMVWERMTEENLKKMKQILELIYDNLVHVEYVGKKK